MTTFGARLHAAIAERGPLCVGIDPHAALLAAWGLGDDAAGLERFARTVVDALADRVAVLKPQSAFFERFGSRGVAVLERVVAEARAAGALVVVDAKRGDIGSTMQAYADAYADPSSPLCGDAVTASPFLGYESLRPLLDTARAHDRGVFVLALTSNPEGTEVQHAVGRDGLSVAARVLTQARADNGDEQPLGSVGVVVGATVDVAALPAPTALDVNGPLLVPGLGAQGGRPADLARTFADVRAAVLPSTSREVLAAGPDPAALRAAAARTLDAVRAALAP